MRNKGEGWESRNPTKDMGSPMGYIIDIVFFNTSYFGSNLKTLALIINRLATALRFIYFYRALETRTWAIGDQYRFFKDC